MKITDQMTDQALLQVLGERLARARMSGEAATQLSGFLRVCRTLGLLERFELLLPEPVPSPMAQLKHQGRKRQRASGLKAPPAAGKWSWAEQ
jgi:hypothetical protein